MKFRVEAKKLVSALSRAGKVSPSMPKGTPGYLFSVGQDGTCFIYSRSELAVTRVPLEVSDVEGSGDFLYPSQYTGAFRYLKGMLEFTYEPDEATGKHKVQYRRVDIEEGAEGEQLSPRPDMVLKVEPEMSEATTTHEYNPALLRAAIGDVKGYTATKDKDMQDDQKQFLTIQVFDDSKPEWAKGNGVMYAADGYKAAYFECPAFKGKHFPLSAEHSPLAMNFLAECTNPITVRNSPRAVFFEDATGAVLGLTNRIALHTRFAFHSLEKDQFVLTVSRSDLLDAMRHMQAELADDKNRKIKVLFDPKDNTLSFRKAHSSSKAKSDRVRVKEVVKADEEGGFESHVNIDYLIGLFDSAESHEIEFRVAVLVKGSRKLAVFRTIDKVLYDAEAKPALDKSAEGVVECWVTRFMPSME